jgi:Ethanolamine utilization protein EutJ (predicted chaperonin)
VCRKPDDVWIESLVAGTTARVACGLLTGQTTLLGGLGIGHVATVDAKHTASVYGAFEAAQSAVDGLVIPYFDTYRHVRSLLEWL